MSVPIPLSVRLVTGRSDRVVTRDVRDLTFRSTVPGGYASASISLDRPLSSQPDEVGYFGRLVVSDSRHGGVVWDGQLEDPGRTAGDDGEVWQLTAIGPASHTRDRTAPIVYVDRDLQALIPADNATPGAKASVGSDPGDAAGSRQALVLQFPQGLGVTNGVSRAVLRYDRIRQSAQKIGRVNYTWDAGATDAQFTIRALARTDGSLAASDTIRSDTLNVGGGGASGRVVVTNWTNGRNGIDWQLLAGVTGTITTDVCWASVFDVAVRAMLLDKAGVEITSYSTDTILASEVVADLLGRLLPGFDGANASIATTSYAIEQLAYPDGVTPAKVLEDLMLLEPAFFWAAWERNPLTGRNRFEWSPWPTAVRYEADTDDGFRSPGSAAELYNSVLVRYRDPAGEIRTVRRTQVVAVLAAASLTREAFIDLGDEVGVTLTQAQRAGDQFLAEHAYPPNAGTLTVARPVVDLVNARMVQPWEIRPGTLIRVRGVLPRVDALNPLARDGVTVFRVVAATYRASSGSAELELDAYPATVSRALADLRRRPVTRRR